MSRLSKTFKPSATSSRTSMNASARKPSTSASATKAGKGAGSKADSSKTGATKEEGDKKDDVNIPALSILPKTKPKDPKEIEKLKKKTMRRNAPEGEDIKEIKKILAGLKGQDITVQEFITLVGPYTGDNGAALRQVLQEDLTAFRKLARKVYETMTQDVSDVLLNEQADLTEYYRERKEQLQDKIMRAVNEIFDKIPNFDFEKFDRNKEDYLSRVLPIPQQLGEDDEELALQRRQEAYHRLQWLRSEGERLNEENDRLQERLNQLKQMQAEEYKKALEREEIAARKKEELEAAEAEMKNQLEELSESMERSIIEKETGIRLEEDKPPAQKRSAVTGAKKKKSKTQVGPSRAEWNQITAAKIESKQKEKAMVPELSKSTVAASRSSRSRSTISRSQQQQRDRSPFHYSPIKTPPCGSPACPGEGRQVSPFHYSPPKSPIARLDDTARSTDQSTLDDSRHITTTRVETTSKVTDNRPPPRRSRAPQDTWGGFY